MMEPVFYAKPDGPRRRLEVNPGLASRDKAGSPGQVRVKAFTDHACQVVAGDVAATAGDLAVGLEVGLSVTTQLLDFNDLDNYLFPLAQALIRTTKRNVVSAWAAKRHANNSYITVGRAVEVADPAGALAFSVTTSASSDKAAYKEEVRHQVSKARPLPDGGVALQIAFAVGQDRAWPNLWKPTIDALEPILGRDDGTKEWNVRDGRITELGMHCTVDSGRRHDVAMEIRADQCG